MLARESKGGAKPHSADAGSGAGAAATRNTVVAVLSEKVKADMAAMREGKTPMQLPQFTYSYFYCRYGVPEQMEVRPHTLNPTP